MPNKFTQWFDTCGGIEGDGRIILWEHLYVGVLIPVPIGLFVTRYFQSIIPFLIFAALGLAFGYWSWTRDMAYHEAGELRDLNAKTPWRVRIGAIVFMTLLVIIITRWIVTGYY